MGLDMYLYAEKYISSSDAFKKDDPKKYQAILETAEMDNLPKSDYGNIMVKSQVGYWRKANAIHGWFVRECANGVDECQEMYVSAEKLIELRDECVKALANRHNATKPIEADYVHKLDGENSEDIMKLIVDSMKRQSEKSNTKLEDTLDPLAPTTGFFFGSAEKDDYYYKDLEYTVELLNSLLTNKDDYSFIYRASW